MRRVLGVALAALVAAGTIVAVRIARENEPTATQQRPYVTDLPDPDSHLSRFLARGDGQFYAALALDLSLERPEAFSSKAEASYRAQRPLLSVLTWVAAAGRRRAIGPALVVLGIFSAAFAAGACAYLAVRRGGSPLTGLVILLAPGSIAVLGGSGSEMLALGLIALGLVAWTDGQTTYSVIFMTLAAFARETALMVPLSLACIQVWRLRSIRPALPLVVAPMALSVWIGWVHFRVGATPGAAGRVSMPFVGLARAIPRWDNAEANLLVIAVGLAISAGLLWKRRDDLLGLVALAHLAIAAIAGDDVWHAWENFGRPILPLYALGIAALLSNPWPYRTRAVAARVDWEG